MLAQTATHEAPENGAECPNPEELSSHTTGPSRRIECCIKWHAPRQSARRAARTPRVLAKKVPRNQPSVLSLLEVERRAPGYA